MSDSRPSMLLLLMSGADRRRSPAPVGRSAAQRTPHALHLQDKGLQAHLACRFPFAGVHWRRASTPGAVLPPPLGIGLPLGHGWLSAQPPQQLRRLLQLDGGACGPPVRCSSFAGGPSSLASPRESERATPSGVDPPPVRHRLSDPQPAATLAPAGHEGGSVAASHAAFLHRTRPLQPPKAQRLGARMTVRGRPAAGPSSAERLPAGRHLGHCGT